MCSPAPLVLGPGQHVVRAAAGLDTGLDLDRVVFTNGAWSQPAAPTVTAPPVTVRSVSATSVSGRVVSDGSPFWLVLDQSMNEGWSLKVDHAHVDGPRPLDSFASGWLVTPERPGTLAVHASWTPQRSVTAALVVSAAAVLLCGVLVVTGGRRRAAGRTTVLPPVVGTTPPNEDRVVTREVAIAIGTGVATALFLHPLAGPVAAVLVVLARRFPRAGRALPAFLVAVSAVQVVYFEARDDYVTQRTWPQFFAGAHVTALLAVILLASTALTERRAPRMPG
jgi:hypothetical protein